MAGRRGEYRVALTADTRKWKKGMRDASRDTKRFSKDARQAVRGIGLAFAGLGAGVGLFVGNAIKEFASYDKKVREVGTLLGNVTKDQLKTIGEQGTAIATEFGQEAGNVVKGIYDSISAGVDFDQVFGFVRDASALAVAGNTDIATSVDLLTSALNAFQIDAGAARGVVDYLFTTVKSGKTTVDELSRSFGQVGRVAANAGAQLQEMLAWLAAITQGGVKTAEAGTQIKAALAELLRPAGQVNKLFAEITGQGFSKFITQGGTLTDVLRILITYAKDTGTSIAGMFGSIEGAQALMALATTDMESYTAALDAMNTSSGSADQAVAIMKDGVGQSLAEMGAAWEAFKLAVGGALAPLLLEYLPSITGFLQEAVPYVTHFVDSWYGLPIILGVLGLALAGIAILIGGALVNAIVAILPLVIAVAGAIGAISLPVALVIGAILGLIAVFAYLWITNERFREIVTGIWQGIWTFLEPIIQGIWLALKGLGWFLVGVFTLDWQTMKEGLIAIVQGLVVALVSLVGGILFLFLNLGIWLTKGFIALWKLAWDGIGSLLNSFYTWLSTWIANVLLPWFNEKIPIALGALRDIWDRIWNGFRTTASNAWNGIVSAARSAWDTISGYVAKARSALSNLNPGNALRNVASGFGVSIPGLAGGGIVTRPTLAVIGEAGPEAVVPLDRGAGAVGGDTYTLNFYGDVYGDRESIARVTLDALQELVRTNGPLRLQVE